MVLFPTTGLGRLLVVVIIITTIGFLVLNLVSFGGNHWITYVDVPVRFGLWRVCDTRTAHLCNDWSDDQYLSNFTNTTFHGSKPGFIQSSQALEIISLIFYIIAAAIIVVGLLDLDAFPFEVPFIAAAVLLFICIIFLSASLGLMSVQGRHNHPSASLDWAWWNGLIGLIMTIICCFSLIATIFDVSFFASSSPSMESSPKSQRSASGKGFWSRSRSPSMIMSASFQPVTGWNYQTNQPYNYPNVNQDFPPYSSNQPYDYPNVSQDFSQYSSNQFFQNPMMAYGGQPASGQYLNDQSLSPIISALARQYVSQATDAQNQRQLLEPYRQYLRDPYLVNNYL